MSVVFSGSYQGNFVSTGASVSLPIPTGVDWMWVYNQTQLVAAGGGQLVQAYWQRAIPIGSAANLSIQYTKTAVTGALVPAAFAANAGFFLYDTSINIPGANVLYTDISGATPPVVTSNDIRGLANGDIVRMQSGVGAQQVGGIDYTIGNLTPGGGNTGTFELSYAAGIAAAATPGAAAFYRRIPYSPYFYPRNRTIAKIEVDPNNSAQAIVTLLVTNDFTVGQKIRFVLPKVGNSSVYFGMTQLNGIEATIVAVGAADVDGITNTITVDVDVSTFTAFAWPLTTSGRFTPPQVVPVGENTAEALLLNTNILGDSTINEATFGMLLTGGANGPAGVADDVIYWVAGKSFNGI